MYRSTIATASSSGKPVHIGAGLQAVLDQIAQRRKIVIPTNLSLTSTTDNCCETCHGTGWLVPAYEQGQPIPAPVRCAACADYRQNTGLNDQELALTPGDIKGNGTMHNVLRYLAKYIILNPHGWLTLWGKPGTAKSLLAQIVVAGLAGNGVEARYYHARRLEQLFFDDIHNDTSNIQMLRRVPVLVVDELDKANLGNAWVRKGIQELADQRYRDALAHRSLTIWVVQYDPERLDENMGDLVSRMNDGRFSRPWFGEPNEFTVDTFGDLMLPSVIHVTGEDVRPHKKPNIDGVILP